MQPSPRTSPWRRARAGPSPAVGPRPRHRRRRRRSRPAAAWSPTGTRGGCGGRHHPDLASPTGARRIGRYGAPSDRADDRGRDPAPPRRRERSTTTEVSGRRPAGAWARAAGSFSTSRTSATWLIGSRAPRAEARATVLDVQSIRARSASEPMPLPGESLRFSEAAFPSGRRTPRRAAYLLPSLPKRLTDCASVGSGGLEARHIAPGPGQSRAHHDRRAPEQHEQQGRDDRK